MFSRKKQKSPNQWVKVNNSIPKNAIIGGKDSDGRPIYVGRVHAFREILPVGVTVSPESNKVLAHIAYGGRETVSETCKVNCELYCDDNVRWVPASHGNIPQGAIAVNLANSHDEAQYIGRTKYMSQMIVGKIHPSHECLYIPYKKKEIPFKDYEILVKVNVV